MISTSPQGQIIDGPGNTSVWFSDGYGDYIRHFMRAMGALPEWAPHNQSHLTHSTSVVTAVTYAADDIRYTTADPDAIDMLKLAFTPVEVTANGVPSTARESRRTGVGLRRGHSGAEGQARAGSGAHRRSALRA